MEITTQIRIQSDREFWYSVEDYHLDVGCDGCTISYWEYSSEEVRKNHICMTKEEALAIADAIHKLFRK